MDKNRVSFIKFMRAALFVVLGISIIWDILCIFSVLPLKYYTITYVFVLIPSAIISFRSLFFQTRDISVYIGEAAQKEKAKAAIMVFMIFIWIVLMGICIYYRSM
ncbi:hypothetical protein [Clostridium hydrogenum]|uniref:hypothetical protein n=1 Tax=Clostridium hydrogenum TaxID=2855764 RepID=UPI001F48DB3C|nr:hypothetical protein [Clostridium hydrogenum]